MAFEEKVLLLSRVELLEPLSAEEIGWLGQRTPDMRLGRGQILYTPEHASRTLYFLLEGRVRVYKTLGEQQQTLDVLADGTMFGEAALTGRPQGTYAQALEPSWIAMVSLHTLERLARGNPEVGLRMAALLAERLHRYASQMADIALKEVSARLASLILRLCESEGVVTTEGYMIPTRYTQEQLAAMIGARRVAVTRAFNRLRDMGAVELRRRTIYVRDMEALKRVAGP
jgi:CRP/FNR family transcriptional regulator, cyclic AMP receptor protein